MDIYARNDYLVNHENLIKAVIHRNKTFLNAHHLESDDVYQELAIAMLKAIEGFDPEQSASLDTHVRVRLQYAMLNIKKSYKPCGMTGTQRSQVTVSSIDGYTDDGRLLEISVHDDFYEVDISDLFDILTTTEKNALRQSMDGICGRSRHQRDTLEAARTKLKKAYYDACYATYF